MRKVSVILYFILGISIAQAQTVAGYWKAIEKGKPSSIIKIYKAKNGKYYGKMVKILDPDLQGKTCTECSDFRKNHPMKGLVIITGLTAEANEKSASGGKILDPKKGKEYNCKIWIEGKDRLKMRAYWGAFYGTRTWTRVEDEQRK